MMPLPKYNAVTAERPVEPCGSGRSWTQPSLLMLNDKGSRSGNSLAREPFITISSATASTCFRRMQASSPRRFPQWSHGWSREQSLSPTAEDNPYTITICVRSDRFTDSFTDLFGEVNRFSQASGIEPSA